VSKKTEWLFVSSLLNNNQPFVIASDYILPHHRSFGKHFISTQNKAAIHPTTLEVGEFWRGLVKTALVDGCQRTIYYIQLDRHR
jgi:hypothetical protein